MSDTVVQPCLLAIEAGRNRRQECNIKLLFLILLRGNLSSTPGMMAKCGSKSTLRQRVMTPPHRYGYSRFLSYGLQKMIRSDKAGYQTLSITTNNARFRRRASRAIPPSRGHEYRRQPGCVVLGCLVDAAIRTWARLPSFCFRAIWAP
jgi:hypothetical protein